LKLERGAAVFAGIFLLAYTFVIVLMCTIVGGLYLTYSIEESFPNKCFGFSCFWVSWFDSVGNFANSGFTLNPPGYIVYADHPFLPLLMCFCMSAGIMLRTAYMSLCLSIVRRFSPDGLRVYCDHFFQQSVILRTLFDLNAPQLASVIYNVLITFSCTIFFFFAESHMRSFLTGTETVINQLVMFLFLAMSVRWSGTTVMDLSQIGAGSKLVMFCVLGLLEVPFDKCDDGRRSWAAYLNRFTLGVNSLYLCLPLGWIIVGQIGSTSKGFLTFNCMFEVMSAFFNSGVTIPDQSSPDLASLSFIGSLPDASKIVLLFVMLAGRFRKISALPQACKEAIASWKASPDSILDMRQLNQSSGRVALAQVEGHIEPAIQELLDLISTVPAIKSLSQPQQLALCRLVTCENFSDGQVIIRQGDTGDQAYILSKGSVNVKKIIKPGDPELFLVTLQRGSFFGELALINNAPRGASVYAVGETTCIVLSKSTFETIKDSVSSESRERELGYAHSEIEALGAKIESLNQEISSLRRRKSINNSNSFSSQLNPDIIHSSAPSSPLSGSIPAVASNLDPHYDVSLPGVVVSHATPPPVAPVHSSGAIRPATKIRRTLVPLPAPTR
jgi:CRP-like cAMP-binding protein